MWVGRTYEEEENWKEEEMPEQRRPEPGRPTPARPAPARPAPARPAPARPAAPGPAPAKAAPAPVAVKSAAAAVSTRDVPIDSAEAQEQQTRRLAVFKRSSDLVGELNDMVVAIRQLENAQTEHKRTLDKLESQRGPLDAQRKKLQEEVDTATSDIGSLRASIESLTKKRAGLEESTGHHRRERSEHVAAIAGFSAEKEGLIT